MYNEHLLKTETLGVGVTERQKYESPEISLCTWQRRSQCMIIIALTLQRCEKFQEEGIDRKKKEFSAGEHREILMD